MAKQKRKVTMPAGIRNKMMAAVSMLMVSCIMMVSSTYAWFTLSTAPEVKNISTTVAGNGSLEIALMPTDGALGGITIGFSGDTADADVNLANRSWGNIIYLNDGYGLNLMSLNPATLNTTVDGENGDISKDNPLIIAEYGYDGRIVSTNSENITWKSYKEAGFSGDEYGVRVIGENNSGTLGSTYGYIVDLAFRLNSTDANGQNGSLLLQTEGTQRIYAESSNEETMGSGSSMTFDLKGTGLDVKKLMSAIRVTFVQNYGNNATGVTPVILGTAKLDVDGAKQGATTTTAKLYLYETAVGVEETEGEGTNTENPTVQSNPVLVSEMPKNQSVQVSAIVWLDGAVVTNASVAALDEAFATSTLNLQFSTNIKLNPADNNVLMDSITE